MHHGDGPEAREGLLQGQGVQPPLATSPQHIEHLHPVIKSGNGRGPSLLAPRPPGRVKGTGEPPIPIRDQHGRGLTRDPQTGW
jgi:hypothetical protein